MQAQKQFLNSDKNDFKVVCFTSKLCEFGERLPWEDHTESKNYEIELYSYAIQYTRVDGRQDVQSGLIDARLESCLSNEHKKDDYKSLRTISLMPLIDRNAQLKLLNLDSVYDKVNNCDALVFPNMSNEVKEHKHRITVTKKAFMHVGATLHEIEATYCIHRLYESTLPYEWNFPRLAGVKVDGIELQDAQLTDQDKTDIVDYMTVCDENIADDWAKREVTAHDALAGEHQAALNTYHDYVTITGYCEATVQKEKNSKAA